MQRLLLAGCPDFWRLWSVGLVVFTVRWLETVAVGVFVYQHKVRLSPSMMTISLPGLSAPSAPGLKSSGAPPYMVVAQNPGT